MRELEKRTALVTGASSGLGVDFARELAARGATVILAARREDRLNDLAITLRELHGVRVEVVAVDLTAVDAVETLCRQVAESGLSVDILVNNAGFGAHAAFVDLSWEREQQMLELDILALVHLTKKLVPGMVDRGWGRILQVASIGAYQPCPTYASYGAAKAFVRNFSEALHFELSGTGVTCTVISPGATATEFMEVAGQDVTWAHRLTLMSSEAVGRIGIRSMLAGRASVVPGWVNKLAAFSVRFAPRRLATWAAWLVMR